MRIEKRDEVVGRQQPAHYEQHQGIGFSIDMRKADTGIKIAWTELYITLSVLTHVPICIEGSHIHTYNHIKTCHILSGRGLLLTCQH